jgi:hypothetical protein
MAGLQDMRAMVSRLTVISSTLIPILLTLKAASQPACPPPTTTTSGECIGSSTPELENFKDINGLLPMTRDQQIERHKPTSYHIARPRAENQGPSEESGARYLHVTFDAAMGLRAMQPRASFDKKSRMPLARILLPGRPFHV